MKFYTTLLPLGILFLSSFHLKAQTGDTEITEENVCQKIISQKTSLSLSHRFEDLKDFFEVWFRKSALGKPDIWEIGQNPHSDANTCVPSQKSLYFTVKGKNYIVALGIDRPKELSQEEFDEQVASYSELTKEIEEQTKALVSMGARSSVSSCQNRKKKLHFSWVDYQNNLEKKKKLIWGKRYLEYLEVSKIVESEIRARLKIEWNFVKDSSLDNVHRLLRDDRTRHLVLINHGRDNGEIFDGNDSSYPPSFFGNTGRFLESLALFSCHSKEAISYYDLNRTLATKPSTYHSRVLFSVKPNQIQHEKNIAPISSLKYFLRHIDSYIYYRQCSRSTCEATTVLRTNRKDCHLESHNLNLNHGTLGFTLNGQFIGSLTAPKHGISLDFNCNLLQKEGEYNLVVSNLRFYDTEKIIVENADFDVSFNLSRIDKKVVIKSQKTVFADDQSFRKRLFKLQVLGSP
ncbi:MAG: hypothetical protein KA436_06090 [Oligoflexales bacterium]|nr:hypothetical protein [Oligoflexales bacterium]